MIKTLPISSWSLIGGGVLMTAWLYPHAWAFTPYLVLPFGITASRRVATQAVMLVVTLCSVCVGFWYFWDAAHIHLSTLNLLPVEVVAVESAVACLTSFLVRRIDRLKHETQAV